MPFVFMLNSLEKYKKTNKHINIGMIFLSLKVSLWLELESLTNTEKLC